MKTLRKNIDLESNTVAILQIEATLNGHGTLKPYLEEIIKKAAFQATKSRPDVYKKLLDTKPVKSIKKNRQLAKRK